MASQASSFIPAAASPRAFLAEELQRCIIYSPPRSSPSPMRERAARKATSAFASLNPSTASAPKSMPRRISPPKRLLTEQIEQCQSFADFNFLWKGKQSSCSPTELLKFFESSATYRSLPRATPEICQAITKRLAEFSLEQMISLLATAKTLRNYFGPEIEEKANLLAQAIEKTIMANEGQLQTCSNELLTKLICSSVPFNVQTLLTTIVSKVLIDKKFSELSGSEIARISGAINSFTFANLYSPIDALVLKQLVQNKKLNSCETRDLAEVAYTYRHYEKYRALFTEITNILMNDKMAKLQTATDSDLALFVYALRSSESPHKEAFYKTAQERLQSSKSFFNLDECYWIAEGFQTGAKFSEPLAGLVRATLTEPPLRGRRLLADAEPFHLVSFAKACEALACPNFFSTLEEELCRFKKIQACSGGQIVRLASTFANRGQCPRHLKEAIAREFLSSDKLETCSLDEVASLALTMNGYSNELYRKIEAKLLKDTSSATASAKQLVRLATGFANSNYPAEKLFKQISFYITSKFSNPSQYNYSPSEVVQLANAYKSDMEGSKELFAVIRKLLVNHERLLGCSPDELADMLNVFKKDESTAIHKMAREHLLKNEAALINTLDHYTLSRLIEGFSHTSSATKPLFAAFEARFFELFNSKAGFTLEDLSQCLHGFARSGFASVPFLNALENTLVGIISSFSEQQMIDARRHLFMAAWAMVCAGRTQSKLISLFAECCAHLTKANVALHSSEKTQLAQIDLAIRLENPQSYRSLITPEVQAIVKGHKEALRLTPPDSSKFHLEISNFIKTNFKEVAVKNEESLEGLIVDIWLPGKNRAVEVNGPTHYVEDGATLNGVSQFKMRLIAKLTGNPCIPINGEEWSSARRQNTKAYVKYKIIDGKV